jgi:hypothetical protein
MYWLIALVVIDLAAGFGLLITMPRWGEPSQWRFVFLPLFLISSVATSWVNRRLE